MAEIKLYLDEDVSHTAAVVLRSRGYDVVSAHEVGMRGKSDEEQLCYAIENERTFLTFNARHFVPLTEALYEERREHFGIIISKQVSLSEIIRLAVKMLNVCKVSDLKNSLIWLQSFK